MHRECHTVVVGGGCLGAAAAVSLANMMPSLGHTPADVCLIEKMVVGSGLSARHSGIVRAANADGAAAQLADRAAQMWRNIKQHWGVDLPVEHVGAVWIAKDSGDGGNLKWDGLKASLKERGIDFGQVSLSEARRLLPAFVRLKDDEVFYYEPDACQMDPTEVRRALYQALRKSGVTLQEKTEVRGFERDDSGAITAVHTDQGTVRCKFVVNAAGPWSPAIFSRLGITIPVSVEPVNVANWLTSLDEVTYGMPIIADYVNLAYFRLWRDGEIHMHQPRSRGATATARAFSECPMHVLGADFMNEPSNQALGYSQIRIYEEMARQRFSNVDRTVYGSGYRSYFDITPDLRFILGPDPRVPNLIHNLGSGQAFKYSPVFGELMAQLVAGQGPLIRLSESFSIARFDDSYMSEFWGRVRGVGHSLATETATL